MTLFSHVCLIKYPFHTCLQGEAIEHAPDIGILVGGHSLALRGVSRHEAGPYVCLASNVVGEGASPALDLQVNCE